MKLIRKMWGVVLPEKNEVSHLLGVGWQRQPIPPQYDGDGRSMLLFKTRKQARAWRAERNAFYRLYPEGHLCRQWKFKVVRVEQVFNY